MEEIRLITDYSEKSFAVAAPYDCYYDEEFKTIGGRFNSRLACGGGWIFSTAKHLDAVRNLLAAYGIAYADSTLTSEERAALESKRQARKNATGSTKATSAAGALRLLTSDEKTALGIDAKDYALRLADNIVITHHPTSLKTEFCFGYSCCGQGVTIKEANELKETAKTDPAYFISENLSDIKNKLERLTNPDASRRGNKYPWIANYHPRKKNWQIDFMRAETASGLYGEELEMYQRGDLLPLTSEEKELVSEFYKYCMEQRRKRCESYLKRYGLDKLHVWTYDSDY